MSTAARPILLTYGYVDMFGYPYGTNPKWPQSNAYGGKQRDRIKKRPGRTPVMLEVADCRKRGHTMSVLIGGYGTWPLHRWIHFPHEGTGNALYDDGSVVAEPEGGELANTSATDCF